MHRLLSTAALVLVLAAVTVSSSVAQNNRFTDRSFVSFPSVEAMGDAGVAFPGHDRTFFYNPSQLTHVSSHFTVGAVQAAASPRLGTFVRFFNDRVAPAIETEFDMRHEAQEALYQDASRFARRPSRGEGVVTLPSFAYTSDLIGVGGGLFAKTALNYRVEEGGGTVPEVFLLSRTDVMALASLGLNLSWLGLDGLSVGVTGTRTQRFLAFKNKPINELKPDEPAVLLTGNTFQVDLGMLYTPTWWNLPGELNLGGAVYDILDEGYDYTPGGPSDRLPFLEGMASYSETSGYDAASPEVQSARQRFGLETSYRFGLAYQLSSLFFLEDLSVVVDYQQYGEQTADPMTRLHGGIEARLGTPLYLRVGYGAGLPAGGVGLRFGVLQLDYAFYGIGEEQSLDPLATYVHSAQLTFRFR